MQNGLISIDNHAFCECNSLTSVEIPASIKSIGKEAFSFCDGLLNINVEPTNSVYKSVDGILFNKDMTELVSYPDGRTDTSYTIPSSVTTIGDFAFKDCYNLTSIDIPSGVTTIGDSAFVTCFRLTSLEIPDSVTSIGVWAFLDCSNLTSVEIPSSVTSIGRDAFGRCSSLKDVYYGGSEGDWNKIEFDEWSNDSLKNANIHFNSTMETQTSTESTTVSTTETTTESTTYSTTETTTETSTETTTESGVQSVDGAYLTFDEGKGEITGCDSVVTGVIIPEELNGVKPAAIGESAFSGSKDMEIIAIPESVTSISENAFTGCTDGMVVWCEKGSYADNAALYPVSVTFKYFEPVTNGSADGDDLLTAGDSAEILQKVLNNSYKMPVEEKTPYWLKHINVDGDDIITASDSSYVLQKVLDSSFKFPVEG